MRPAHVIVEEESAFDFLLAQPDWREQLTAAGYSFRGIPNRRESYHKAVRNSKRNDWWGLAVYAADGRGTTATVALTARTAERREAILHKEVPMLEVGAELAEVEKLVVERPFKKATIELITNRGYTER